MSNEPLDLNAWLTGDPPKVEAAPFTTSEEVFPPEGERYGETAGMTPAEPEHQFNFKPLSSPFTEEHHRAVETVTGKRPTVDEELGFGDPREPALPHQGDTQALIEGAVTMIENLDADLRTVGDRVTILWERQGEFLAVLQSIDARLSKLLEMVAEDPDLDTNGVDIDTPPVLPTAPPKRTRTRKPKAFEVVAEPQPEPTSDIAF